MNYVLLALLGLVVGTFGTLVGAGGGFILTPVLLVVYPTLTPAEVTSISLLVVFFNALSGSIAYARLKRIDYRSGLRFAAAGIPGSIPGALAVHLALRPGLDVGDGEHHPPGPVPSSAPASRGASPGRRSGSSSASLCSGWRSAC